MEKNKLELWEIITGPQRNCKTCKHNQLYSCGLAHTWSVDCSGNSVRSNKDPNWDNYWQLKDDKQEN